MNKIFYKLDIDTSRNYSDLSKFINLLSKNQIKSFFYPYAGQITLE